MNGEGAATMSSITPEQLREFARFHSTSVSMYNSQEIVSWYERRHNLFALISQCSALSYSDVVARFDSLNSDALEQLANACRAGTINPEHMKLPPTFS